MPTIAHFLDTAIGLTVASNRVTTRDIGKIQGPLDTGYFIVGRYLRSAGDMLKWWNLRNGSDANRYRKMPPI